MLYCQHRQVLIDLLMFPFSDTFWFRNKMNEELCIPLFVLIKHRILFTYCSTSLMQLTQIKKQKELKKMQAFALV